MTCITGKSGYETKKIADSELRIIKAANNRRKKRKNGKKFDLKRSYFCDHCGEWHLTHIKNFKPRFRDKLINNSRK